jgi:hypothetical protein
LEINYKGEGNAKFGFDTQNSLLLAGFCTSHGFQACKVKTPSLSDSTLEHDRKFCFLSFRISRRNKITKYEKRNLEKASTCFG